MSGDHEPAPTTVTETPLVPSATRGGHALAAGVPLEAVQERLGHVSSTPTADSCRCVLAADLVARLITELP